MEEIVKQLGGLTFVSMLLWLTGIGCIGSDPGKAEDGDTIGTLSLPLVADSPNGVKYRLRDAVFDINPNYWYGYGGAGGSEGQVPVVVNSEDDPDATSIQVSLERGYYYINLRSGWRMEKIENGEAQTVEATLLNSGSQWIYINPHSTSSVSFQFGIGNRKIWLNGNLNIQIDVYDNPGQYYGDEDGGAAGYGGYGGTGGAGGSYPWADAG
jgi:hypothetical protein